MSEHVIQARPIVIHPPVTKLDLMFDKKQREAYDRLNQEIGLPDARRYYVIPVGKPYLRSYIRSFTWDCVQSIISMEIDETPTLGAFDWLHNLYDEKETIVLVLFNTYNNEIARIKFQKLALISHSCALCCAKDDVDIEADTEPIMPVRHNVVFRFDTCEHTKKEECSELNNRELNNTGIEDWMGEKLETKVDKPVETT